jgi:hypothetical protein
MTTVKIVTERIHYVFLWTSIHHPWKQAWIQQLAVAALIGHLRTSAVTIVSYQVCPPEVP